MIQFGSSARDDVHEGSDVDLVVDADFRKPFLDRIRLLDLNDGIGLPLQAVGYTPKEFRQMREAGNCSVQEVPETGWGGRIYDPADRWRDPWGPRLLGRGGRI
ncbi:MAG: nucleotidyltransferase domain-containing protein [Armatimonadota bacterium]|nr:nucleotidyltransferase domain-containing protein [Armatimonadota bacterium]MDW8156905.1 nucleotidyltransferase domain-containing protein [Armatimonadota bacterium]